jgi:hypothetical protein
LARWREPVLREPVLILESDDWGAGPPEQANALRRIAALLSRTRDARGRAAVMTLGVVFEVPDGPSIEATGCTEYRGLPLADPVFSDVRAAMLEGIESGVFVPQLHGQCHYWPASVLAVAEQDAAVRAWLTGAAPALSEALPSPLQSRWVDASVLPSRPHAAAAIEAAVAAEVADYRAIFGAEPKVAVANTFVWTPAVEAAWARAGVEVIVTPGRRATARTASGAPGGVDRQMLSGETSVAGPAYLVRDVYFEPERGHRPQQLVQGLQARARQGRAALVETHRHNFLHALDASLATLEDALRASVACRPDVRFCTPLELARAVRERDPDWIETRFARRFSAWTARLDEIPRFRRAARASGLHWLFSALGGRA